MKRVSKGAVASLLVMAVLATPASALASTFPSVASEKPVTLPAPAKESGDLVAPNLTREQAIAAAKKAFTIPAELGEPNVSIQQTQQGATWTLDWQSSSKQPDRTHIGVGVDGVTGHIVSYYFSSSKQSETLQLSFTRAEAQAKAEEWFNKLVPAEYKGSLRLVSSPLNVGYYGGTSHRFNWVRDIKGYPMAGSGVNITVDARSGDIQSYNLSWQLKGDFTLPEKVLSQAEAEAAYQKSVPMVLQYQRFTKRGTQESEWKLVYQPLLGQFPRMNQEGVVIGWDGEPVDLATLNQTRLVAASEKPYAKPAKPLTQEEALAIARALTGRTDTPNHSSYSEYGEEVKRSAWDFGWTIESDENRFHSEQRVRIDAETGLVTEVNHWTETKPFEKGEKAPVSLEQAQEKAIAFIRTHRPDLAGNLQLRVQPPEPWMTEEDYRPTEYYIPFQMLKNGLPVSGRELQVSINARTGEVRHFWSGWWDEQPNETFPAPAAKLSAEDAMAQFFTQQGLELAWASYWSHKTNSETNPALMWQPVEKLPIRSIDANSGAPLDWEGRNLIEAQRYPSDIKGHAAEREIELLWARGVFELQDGKFNPDAAVTAEDLARWIVLARGYRPYMAYDFALAEKAAGSIARQAATSANSAYFGAALQNGIILPEELATIKSLSSSVPREMFALWAARAMGYGRIAKMETRVELKFIDADQIDAKYQNAVALLNGLGVISGDYNNKFNPKQALTRADAARILFAVSAEGRY